MIGMSPSKRIESTANSFTLFYVGSRHDYHDYDGSMGLRQTSRQFFLKFQYLVRV